MSACLMPHIGKGLFSISAAPQIGVNSYNLRTTGVLASNNIAAFGPPQRRQLAPAVGIKLIF